MTKKILELSSIQNTILVRIGSAERMETSRLLESIANKRAMSTQERQDLDKEVRMQLQLLSLYGLVSLSSRHGGREICIASSRVREWLPDHLKRAEAEGIMHRPSITLPFMAAAAIAATGCSTMSDFWASQEPAPVVASYSADKSMLKERMEQFRDARGNMVYRYCVGNECPQPTPKQPPMRRLPTVMEVTEDGTILPSEPPASVPIRPGDKLATQKLTKEYKVAPAKMPESLPGSPKKPLIPPVSMPNKPPPTPLAVAAPAPMPTPSAYPLSNLATTPQALPAQPAPPPPPASKSEQKTLPTGALHTAPQIATLPSIQSGEIADLVSIWASLWSERNATAYFGLYAETFKAPTGQRAKDWMAGRAGIMKRAANITVAIDNLQVSQTDGTATATFMQNYDSPRFKSRIMKRLELVKVDGNWLITRETVLAKSDT